MTQPKDLKILIVGDIGVGKTSLLQRYVDNVFSEQPIYTLGVDFKTKIVDHNGMQYKLLIHDTAGQERYFALTSNFYRDADGIILVYDVTNKDSYENVKQWFQEIGRYGPEARKVLVGNKIDLISEKIIDTGVAKDYADSFPLPFIEASAKSGQNIDDIFKLLLNTIGNVPGGRPTVKVPIRPPHASKRFICNVM